MPNQTDSELNASVLRKLFWLVVGVGLVFALITSCFPVQADSGELDCPCCPWPEIVLGFLVGLVLGSVGMLFGLAGLAWAKDVPPRHRGQIHPRGDGDGP